MNLENKIPPPIVMMACAGIMYLIEAFLSIQTFVVLPDISTLTVSWVTEYLVPATFLLAGIGWIISGILCFKKAQTTINPLAPHKAGYLVTNSVYKITRNPMYLGMVFVLFAWAIFLQTVTGLLGVLLFVLYINQWQITPEERALKSLFGDEFTAYCDKVRRWL